MKSIKLIILTSFGLLAALACSEKKENKENEEVHSTSLSTLSQKETQYYSNGRKLYKTICSNCHMENGAGLGRLIPPLAKSDYLINNRGDLARVLKYGINGPMTVNGINYNQPMPANPNFTDLEIAEILTYIGNTWGNEMGGFSIEEVVKDLAKASAND
ncbi:MAG: cytochrome C [Cytophagales bacterium CG12_big_fil_rev_8_21_14_0_65_40_12]|nr:MAG: cytochrome C [Cytophagales bacterium CG12_big_fil_rev_8_21_14_0_65_40_12]PIW06159.1 MAG: cytochrome C [Cytophagales bacterium CG17_big_fil_post_rev_8_21_14_2_50_40_13]